jgi:DNA polymerase-3 subunit alpha
LKWFPLRNHSHFSFQLSPTRPEQFELAGAALTDRDSLAGLPSFVKKMKGKKAISGLEASCPQGRFIILVKNQDGWEDLLRATHRNQKQPLELAEWASYARNWIVLSGGPGTTLGKTLFTDPEAAWVQARPELRTNAGPDWKKRLQRSLAEHQELFPSFYPEIQYGYELAEVTAKSLLALGAKGVATADTYYLRPEDAADQRLLVCAREKTTLKRIASRLAGDIVPFFQSNSFHHPSDEEMVKRHSEEELKRTFEIADQCETLSFTGPPLFPAFISERPPNKQLEYLCAKGWQERLGNVDKTVYAERIKKELKVIQEAGLASYFLIVQDIVEHARQIGCMVGRGRGSAAGCLVSYLLRLTSVDPIPHGLVFERFYNAGRNSADRIALPDIDIDFPDRMRDQIIEYIRGKYGENQVAQMATFQRLQGRGAFKQVMRVRETCAADEMNRITKGIPDEAKIAGELQEMKEAGLEPSILRWTLENRPEALKEWCWLNEQGQLEGPLALEMAQAIRLEKIKIGTSKHASGVIICSTPLYETVPMLQDKSSDHMLVAVDMRDAEDMGLVKVDILGLRTVTRVMGAQNFIRMGHL